MRDSVTKYPDVSQTHTNTIGRCVRCATATLDRFTEFTHRLISLFLSPHSLTHRLQNYSILFSDRIKFYSCLFFLIHARLFKVCSRYSIRYTVEYRWAYINTQRFIVADSYKMCILIMLPTDHADGIRFHLYIYLHLYTSCGMEGIQHIQHIQKKKKEVIRAEAANRWVCNLYSLGTIRLTVKELRRREKSCAHTYTGARKTNHLFLYVREIENRNENLTKFSITNGAKCSRVQRA